jgi:Sel1 repeat
MGAHFQPAPAQPPESKMSQQCKRKELTSFLILLAVFVIFGSLGGCANRTKNGEDMISGNEALNLSDAERLKLEQAAPNDPKAAYKLSIYCDFVKMDSIQALYWLRKSAEAGYSLAEYNLAVILSQSLKKKDREEADTWFKKAAAKGVSRQTKWPYKLINPNKDK